MIETPKRPQVRTPLEYVATGGRVTPELEYTSDLILSEGFDALPPVKREAAVELWFDHAGVPGEYTGGTYFGEPADFETNVKRIRARLAPDEAENPTPGVLEAFDKSPAAEQDKQLANFYAIKSQEMAKAGEFGTQGPRPSGSIATNDEPTLGGQTLTQRREPTIGFEQLPPERRQQLRNEYRERVLAPQDFERNKKALEQQLSPEAVAYGLHLLGGGEPNADVFAALDPFDQAHLAAYVQLVKPEAEKNIAAEAGTRFIASAKSTGAGVLGATSDLIRATGVGYLAYFDPEEAARIDRQLQADSATIYREKQLLAPKYAERGLLGTGFIGLAESLPYTATALNPYAFAVATVGLAKNQHDDLVAQGVKTERAWTVAVPTQIAVAVIERWQVKGLLGGADEAVAALKAAAGKGVFTKTARVGLEVGETAIQETFQEEVQNFVEIVGNQVGTDTFDLGQATVEAMTMLPETAATMFWFSFLGVPGAAARQRSRLPRGEFVPAKALADLQVIDGFRASNNAKLREAVNGQTDEQAARSILSAYDATAGDARAAYLEDLGIDEGTVDKLRQAVELVPEIIGERIDAEFADEVTGDQTAPFVAGEINSAASPERSDRTISPTPAKGLSRLQIVGAVTPAQRVATRAAKTVVVETQAELEKILPAGDIPAGQQVRAARHGGKVYLVAENIRDEADAIAQWAHEQLAHVGLDLRGPEGRAAFLTELQAQLDQGGLTVEKIRAVLPEYADLNLDDQGILEEFLGRTAERKFNGETLTVEEAGFWSRFIEWLQKLFGIGGVDTKQVDEFATVALKALWADLQQPAVVSADRDVVTAEGDTHRVYVPGEGAMEGIYALMPIEQVQASHNEQTFEPNPAYRFANSRDYARQAALQQNVATEAADLDPDLVLSTATSNQEGPPVVTRDGMVLGGNGRTMRIKRARAAHPEKWAAYTEALRARAAEFGLDPRTVAEDSVLVRVVETNDATASRLIPKFNRSLANSESEAEAASSLARLLDDGMVQALTNTGQDQTVRQLLRVQGFEFFQKAVEAGAIPRTEYNRLVDNSGELTKQGRETLESAIVARVVGNAEVYATLKDAEIDLVTRAAAPILRLRSSVTKELLPAEADISGPFAQALAAVTRPKAAAGQSELFEDPIVAGLRELILAGLAKRNTFGPAMRWVADQIAVGEKAVAGESDIFGDEYHPDVAGIVKQAAGMLREGGAKFSLGDQKDKEGRLLAPNGKPSSLNARQWAQVRTPEFKNWFGDWETLARVRAVRDLAAVEIPAGAVSAEDAEASYREAGSVGLPDGSSVELVRGIFGKLARHRNSADILRLVPRFRELLGAAVLAYSEAERNPEKHRNIAAYHNVVAKARMDGREYFVRFTIQEVRKERGQEFHNAALSDVEMTEAAVADVHSWISGQAKVGGSGLDQRLAAWMASVKPESVSKVVDENGEPMVVYHGTPNGDFFEFDASRKGARDQGWLGTGFYFSSQRANALSYMAPRKDQLRFESRMMEVFLNLRNPKVVSLFSEFYYDDGGPAKAREKSESVRRAGHDGVVAVNLGERQAEDADAALRDAKARFPEIVVYDPAQIKSATGNSGAFDPANPDIRFSFKQQPSKADDAALILSERMIQRQKPTLEDAKALVGGDEAKAQETLDKATFMADQVRAKLVNLANDGEVRRELRGVEREMRKQQRIRDAYALGEVRGEAYAEALARLDAAAKREKELALAARSGLDEDTVEAKRLVERFKQAIAPELMRGKAAEAAAEEEPPADPEEAKQEPETPAVEEPALPDLPTEEARKLLRETAATVLEKLVAEGTFSKRKTLEGAMREPVFRADYRATVMSILDQMAEELTYGPARERAINWLRDLKGAKSLGYFEEKAVELIVYINKNRVRQTKKRAIEAMLKLARRYAAGGRVPATKELHDRKLAPEQQAYVALAARILDLSGDKVEDEVQRVTDAINRGQFEGANQREQAKIDEDRVAHTTELRALLTFGGLKDDVRTEAEAAEALAHLQDVIDNGVAEVAAYSQAKQLRQDQDRAEIIPAIEAARGKAGVNPDGSTSMANRIGIAPLQFHQWLEDLTRFAPEPVRQTATNALADFKRKVDEATHREDEQAKTAHDHVTEAVRRIYGTSNSVRVMRELRMPRAEFAKFSADGKTPLSTAQLLQIYGTMAQRFYWLLAKVNRHLARRRAQMGEIAAALTDQDKALLEWFRDYYFDERGKISDVAERTTGMKVRIPDANYIPAKVQRRSNGFSEEHRVVTVVPKALTPRVAHSLDLDEQADVFTVFADRSADNAHFVAFAELAIDMRGVLAHPDTREAIKKAHGKQYEADFIRHITDIASGSVAGGYALPGLKQLRSYMALTRMSFNLVSMLKQAGGLPAVANEIGIRNAMKYIAGAGTKEGRQAMAVLFRSPGFRARRIGGFDEGMANALHSENPTKLGDFFRFGMKIPGFGDTFGAMIVGQGIYRSLRNSPEYMGLSEEEAHQRAVDETLGIVEATQQSPYIKNWPVWLRTWGEPGRALGMFGTATAQALSYELRALRDVAARGDRKAWHKLARAIVINHLIVPSAMQLASVAVRALTGDEPDEKDLKVWLASMLVGPFGGLVILGAFVNAFSQRITGNPQYGGPSTLPIEAVYGDVEALYSLGEALVQEDWDEAKKQADRLGRNVFAPYRLGSKAVENAGE